SATNRLNDLGRALIERPQLSLEIIPAFDPEADRRALAEARLVAVLREIRLEEYATQGTATTEVRLTPEDRARLIPIAFARRFGAGPSREAPAGDTSSSASPDSQAPVLSVEQMERRLIETERIEPADLQKLAAERATAVQAFLTTAIGLEPERVSIASDDTDNPGKGESRVTFRLQ